MRKLVPVRTIQAIEPIPGADLIARATVDGWKCVVMKDEFKVGDPCLYFEIDSWLSETDPRFEFLMQHKFEWDGRVGLRIRTRHFMKQVSQGLAMPLDLFPEVRQLIEGQPATAVRSMDFADVVGVLKWEAIIPDEIAGEMRGSLPGYIPTTGAERIQNLPSLLVEEPDTDWEETVKIDGYSTTVFKHLDESGICGKTWVYKDDADNETTRTVGRQKLLEALIKHPKSLALQGELIGPGIRKNKERLEQKRFMLFHIWDIAQSRKMDPAERDTTVLELRALGADLTMVPTNGIFKLRELGTMDELLERAYGPSMNPEVKREGLVYNQVYGRGSFKVISNKYLLKNSDS